MTLLRIWWRTLSLAEKVAHSGFAPSSVAESLGAPSSPAKKLPSTPQKISKIALGSSSGSSGNDAAKNLVEDSEPCDEL